MCMSVKQAMYVCVSDCLCVCVCVCMGCSVSVRTVDNDQCSLLLIMTCCQLFWVSNLSMRKYPLHITTLCTTI